MMITYMAITCIVFISMPSILEPGRDAIHDIAWLIRPVTCDNTLDRIIPTTPAWIPASMSNAIIAANKSVSHIIVVTDTMTIKLVSRNTHDILPK